MAYQVEVDYAPAYELLVSLLAFTDRSQHKTLELGRDWAGGVKRRLPPQTNALIEGLNRKQWAAPSMAAVWRCPGDRTVDGFLGWLASVPPGQYGEWLTEGAPGLDDPPAGDPGTIRDRHVEVLLAWHEGYFREAEAQIARGLAAEAGERRVRVTASGTTESVEEATGGVYLTDPSIDRVVLVPQFHYRPWNLHERCGSIMINLYPADIIPAAPGEIPPALMRLTRALSDESRLRILRFVASGPRSFTDVVRFARLAKSTVHHHLVALRASGLVRVHVTGEVDYYSLRTGALEELGQRLGSYLKD